MPEGRKNSNPINITVPRRYIDKTTEVGFRTVVVMRRVFVVGDTSVGDMDGGPVDIGVGLSCNPPGPRAGISGHRRQAAALPSSMDH